MDTKVCRICKQEKPIEAFIKWYTFCRKCRGLWLKQQPYFQEYQKKYAKLRWARIKAKRAAALSPKTEPFRQLWRECKQDLKLFTEKAKLLLKKK